MKRSGWILIAAMALVLFSATAPAAGDGIKINGSAQMFAAFVDQGTRAFSTETGVPAEAVESTSGAGAKAIIDGACDVAAVARRLKMVEKAEGKDLVETLVANDALAVYVHRDNPVQGLSLAEVQRVFSGQIGDWKDLGGPPGPVKIVIPQTKTACNKNFQKAAMGQSGYAPSSVITELASDTLDRVRADRSAISFVSYGAIANKTDFKALKIDGKAPGASGYPLIQEMYLVTRGRPAGRIKQYVDYFVSGNGKKLIVENGMFAAN